MQIEEAVRKLKQGNNDYINNSRNNAAISISLREKTANEGQTPYAIILTCSDSRVPPEHIFSAGVGELFVIRTAGNIVNDKELGSIEFGVKYLGAKVVVVMGHSLCGAVSAAMTGSFSGKEDGHIAGIVNEIRQVIEGAANQEEAEKINIFNSYNKIMKSAIVADFVKTGKISVLKAKYDLHTGKVAFFN